MTDVTKSLKRVNVAQHEIDSIKDRAIKRAERRVEEREHLRLEIQTRKHLVDMGAIADLLHAGYYPNPNDPENPEAIIPLTRDRIASLKAAADIKDKLIRKVLPDLKQVEITEDEKTTGGKILENIELSNRLRLYLESLSKRGVEIDITPTPVPEPVDFLA